MVIKQMPGLKVRSKSKVVPESQELDALLEKRCHFSDKGAE